MKKIISLVLVILVLIPGAAFAASPATPTTSTVYVNGERVGFDAYNISDNNYFKLRDLAYVLNGTAKQFEVTWDGANDAIRLLSGQAYTPNGSEMQAKGAASKTATDTTARVFLDGKQVSFTAYNIDGNNYFKLRDIGSTIDFSVEWDGVNSAISIDTSKGYTPEATVTSYVVTRVIDGDTFEIDFNGKTEKVRLIGVDTPESVHPDANKNVEYGKIASAFTKEYLTGKSVVLEFDVQERDLYGRLLAYVWVDGIMFNKTLLENGHAQVATYPPNVKYVDDFTALQATAREKGVGFWAYESSAGGDNGGDVPVVGNVYIPQSGTKYHSTPTCSGMNNPSHVTVEYAESHGYTPCAKCW